MQLHHPKPGSGNETVAMGRRATRAERRDEEFTAYLHARQPSLLRTAYLLTGDRHQAEDVLQTSLAKLYLAWDKVRDRDSVDAYVRRIMVNENNSLWRRGWKKRGLAASPEPPRLLLRPSLRTAPGPRCASLVRCREYRPPRRRLARLRESKVRSAGRTGRVRGRPGIARCRVSSWTGERRSRVPCG